MGSGRTAAVYGKLEAKAPSEGGEIAIDAGMVLLAGTLNSGGTGVSGLNLVSYRTAFDATGGRMISGPNSPTTGNIVQCNCADVSPMDSVCDANVCLNDPVGLDPAKVTPAVQLTPLVLAP